jgi:hypothetical protein
VAGVGDQPCDFVERLSFAGALVQEEASPHWL